MIAKPTEVEVMAKVKCWIDTDSYRYDVFWNLLSERLRSRDPYYRDTVDQRELYYLAEYRDGDFASVYSQVLNADSQEMGDE